MVLVLVADHLVFHTNQHFQQLTTASKGGQSSPCAWISCTAKTAPKLSFRPSRFDASGIQDFTLLHKWGQLLYVAITSMICLSTGYRRNKEHASCIFMYSSNRMQDWARSCLLHVFPCTCLWSPLASVKICQGLQNAKCHLIGWENQKSIQSEKLLEQQGLLSFLSCCLCPRRVLLAFLNTFNFKSKKWTKDEVQGWWSVYLWS